MRNAFFCSIFILSGCGVSPTNSDTKIIVEDENGGFAKEQRLVEKLKPAIVAKVKQSDKGAKIIASLEKEGYKLEGIHAGPTETAPQEGKHVYTLIYERPTCPDNKIAVDEKSDADVIASTDEGESRMSDLAYSLRAGLDNNLFENFKQQEADRLDALEVEACAISKEVEVEFDRALTSDDAVKESKIISIRVGREQAVFAALR